MMRKRRTSVIIPAAGEGRRFGSTEDGRTKPFVLLGGRPLVVNTLRPFMNSSFIDEIIVPTKSEHVGFLESEIKASFSGQPRVRVISGGLERQDSVKAALQIIDHDGFVLVHDGVRPFITEELIRKVLEMLSSNDAVIVGVRPKDTVKRGLQNIAESTLDRSTLWLSQTPQGFRVDLLKKAFEKAEEDRFVGTDESSLVERLGVPVQILEGSHSNIKITTPEDLAMAQALSSFFV